MAAIHTTGSSRLDLVLQKFPQLIPYDQRLRALETKINESIKSTHPAERHPISRFIEAAQSIRTRIELFSEQGQLSKDAGTLLIGHLILWLKNLHARWNATHQNQDLWNDVLSSSRTLLDTLGPSKTPSIHLSLVDRSLREGNAKLDAGDTQFSSDIADLKRRLAEAEAARQRSCVEIQDQMKARKRLQEKNHSLNGEKSKLELSNRKLKKDRDDNTAQRLAELRRVEDGSRALERKNAALEEQIREFERRAQLCPITDRQEGNTGIKNGIMEKGVTEGVVRSERQISDLQRQVRHLQQQETKLLARLQSERNELQSQLRRHLKHKEVIADLEKDNIGLKDSLSDHRKRKSLGGKKRMN